MEVMCFDIVCVLFPSVNGKLFFVGLIFFGVCGVLFKVLSKSVFSIFRRGSEDETMMRSATL